MQCKCYVLTYFGKKEKIIFGNKTAKNQPSNPNLLLLCFFIGFKREILTLLSLHVDQ